MKRRLLSLVVRGVGSGIARGAERMGVTISDYTFTPSSIPSPGSYRYSCTATQPNGVQRYRIAHVTIAGTMQQIQTTSAMPEESALFEAFVQSFRKSTP